MKASLKKVLRILSKTFLIILSIIFVIGLFTLDTVDYTHYHNTEYYKKTIKKVDAISFGNQVEGNTIRAGWASENITPKNPCNLAGFGNRGNYESVKDSVYTKAIVLTNDHNKIAIVSLDLLYVNKELEHLITQRADSMKLGLDGIYFTAIHSHSSFGNWNSTLGGEFVFGDYDPKIVEHIVSKTVNALQNAALDMDTVEIASDASEQFDFVHNRLVNESFIDTHFRAMLLRKTNGKQAMFCTFAAHPTYLTEYNMQLSADYVGHLRDALREKLHLDFCMFGAGAVGSHAPNYWITDINDEKDFGIALSDSVIDQLDSLNYQRSNLLGFTSLDVALGEPQLRSSYTLGLRIRSWVFNSLVGNPQPQLKFLRIGELFFAGTPCDFSGEFVEKIEKKLSLNHKNLFITSFNGEYIGYAIPSQYYSLNSLEAKETNWYGPFTGVYLNELIEASLAKLQ